MPTPEPDREDRASEFSLVELVTPVVAARTFIWRVTVVVALIAVITGAAYYVWQPSRWTASIGFRPIFLGAEQGKYPNGLPFSPSDVVDRSIVDAVFDKSQMQQFCSREAFRGGLTIQQTSPASQALEADYQARLADLRISGVERQRLLDEYTARRQTLPVQFRLIFIRPLECGDLPPPVLFKALSDLLQTWADESEHKRGVLKQARAILSPAIFDANKGEDTSLLVRADLIRSSLMRVIANIGEVQQLSGAELIRLPEQGGSFIEVRSRLEALVQAQLDPLIAIAGRGLGEDSIAWVEQSLKVAMSEHKVAQDKANAYVNALREYSGVPTTPPPGAAAAQNAQNPSDVQALTPQIEGTFIDRIVGMSAANTAFRQDLTRQMVQASVAAVALGGTVEHYRELLASLRAPRGASLPPAEVAQRLEAVAATGKELTRRFNALYDEFSRVSLRASSAMYRIEEPVSSTTLRSFVSRDFVMLLIGVLILTPIILALGVLLRDRWRRLTVVARST